MYGQIDECDRKIEELTALLDAPEHGRARHIIEDDIRHEKHIRAPSS